jgi:hypothetical protein
MLDGRFSTRDRVPEGPLPLLERGAKAIDDCRSCAPLIGTPYRVLGDAAGERVAVAGQTITRYNVLPLHCRSATRVGLLTSERCPDHNKTITRTTTFGTRRCSMPCWACQEAPGIPGLISSCPPYPHPQPFDGVKVQVGGGCEQKGPPGRIDGAGASLTATQGRRGAALVRAARRRKHQLRGAEAHWWARGLMWVGSR